MRLSEARHRQVVATATATVVGRIDGVVLVGTPGRIAALRVGKTHGPGWYLPWSELRAFGQDAVTIDATAAIRVPESDDEARNADQSLDIVDKLILDDAGDGLGRLRDIDFDPESGSINLVITDRGELAGCRLLAVGSHAAVFAAAPPHL